MDWGVALGLCGRFLVVVGPTIAAIAAFRRQKKDIDEIWISDSGEPELAEYLNQIRSADPRRDKFLAKDQQLLFWSGIGLGILGNLMLFVIAATEAMTG